MNWNDILCMLILLWNWIVFTMYLSDKHKARKGEWRTPEKKLLLSALCLGGVGAFCAMYLFNHKTLHSKFVIIVPISAALTFFVSGWLLSL